MGLGNSETVSHERRAHCLGLLAIMQVVKAAVVEFEDGEINLEDAVRRIVDAAAIQKAA